MTLKEKRKVRRFERYWKKQGRKDLFTWVHRYLRLHSELLADIYNRNGAEQVNKYKPLVDDLYKFWKENPNTIHDIRI